MQRLKSIIMYSLGAATVIAIIFLTAYTEPQSSAASVDRALLVTEKGDTLSPAQNVHAPKLPEAVDFAGEALPMNNFDAKERLDRELVSNCFRHSSTFLIFKKANRYFPVIEPILEEEGLPNDFKYLVVVESALSNAVSAAGAKGFWQFMESSAKEQGLEISKEVDERYDLEKATRAACRYLKEAKQKLGSWTLAAAAYNMGEPGLRAAIEEQGVNNYFDLDLKSETSRYIPKIMAIKIVMQQPKQYGFNFSKSDLYPPMTNVKIVEEKGGISDLATFAQQHKTTYRMLKEYNPWLRQRALTNKSKKTYQIKIPV